MKAAYAILLSTLWSMNSAFAAGCKTELPIYYDPKTESARLTCIQGTFASEAWLSPRFTRVYRVGCESPKYELYFEGHLTLTCDNITIKS